MDRQSIDRINYFARLAKTRALTPEETEERDRLRKRYLAAFREQMRAKLESTDVEYPDGRVVSLKDAAKK